MSERSKKLTGTLRGTGRFFNKDYHLDFSGPLDFDGVTLNVKVTGRMDSTPKFRGSLILKCAEGTFEAYLLGSQQGGGAGSANYNVNESSGCFSEFYGGQIEIGFKHFVGDKINLIFEFG